MLSRAPHSKPHDGSQPAEIVRLTLLRLAELDRLREAGMVQAERLTMAAEGLSPHDEYRRMVGPGGRSDRWRIADWFVRFSVSIFTIPP